MVLTFAVNTVGLLQAVALDVIVSSTPETHCRLSCLVWLDLTMANVL